MGRALCLCSVPGLIHGSELEVTSVIDQGLLEISKAVLDLADKNKVIAGFVLRDVRAFKPGSKLMVVDH